MARTIDKFDLSETDGDFLKSFTGERDRDAPCVIPRRHALFIHCLKRESWGAENRYRANQIYCQWT